MLDTNVRYCGNNGEFAIKRIRLRLTLAQYKRLILLKCKSLNDLSKLITLQPYNLTSL